MNLCPQGFRRRYPPIRSNLGIPSSPSLRVSALGRQSARGAGRAALGTGAWSLMLLGPKGGSTTVGYTHALRRGCLGVRSWADLV